MLSILLLLSTLHASPQNFPYSLFENKTISIKTPLKGQSASAPLVEIQAMLAQQAKDLNKGAAEKVLQSIACARNYNISHKQILAIIDYSLPSNQKRLWIFDLQNKTLLFHTYVSHGIKSGALLTEFFSNKYNSKASSLGVYKTEKSYFGREGLSLRLAGIDRRFNDNAANRYIVMHGGWYMDEQFIKRYGRPGRSWGCPAVPLSLYQDIINTIKEDALLIVYYPSEAWFSQSKFLNCHKGKQITPPLAIVATEAQLPEEAHEEVLFLSNKRADDSAILTMSADRYEQVFHHQAPLERMLRRQINRQEYIALSSSELGQLIVQQNKDALASLSFVVPTIITVRGGYYETQMKIITVGHIKEFRVNPNPPDLSNANSVKQYWVELESGGSLHLRPSKQFIRWLGL